MIVNVSFIFYTTQFEKAVYIKVDVYFGNCSYVAAANGSCYYHEAFKKYLHIIIIVNKLNTSLVQAILYFSYN